jgi:hypothetical protein
MSDAVVAGHLDESVRQVLQWDDARRIAHIDRDLWIGYGRAREAHARLEQILRSERRMRPDNLLIIGASNNGKSAIARRFQARQVPPEDPQAERSRIPVALIQAPNGPRIPPLLAAILAALGRDAGARRTTAQLRIEAFKAMHDAGLRLLLTDDLHNIKGSGTAAMLVELRETGSVTGVSPGCFATREIAYVLRQDEQLANRLEPFVLPRWRGDDPDYLRLLATFGRALPLRQPSVLTEPEIAARILAMGEGLIGGIARVLRRAAAEAVRTGHERIDATLLDRVQPGLPAALEDLAQAADL